MSPFDTIVAPITGSQPAAVAVIRVSGPDAWKVASHVFPNWPARPESHRAIYGRYVTGDDGLALPFAVGHSYTGEESVELSCHGSPASVRALVDACISAGARAAEPGEFTQRAFLNGRLDLTGAEAVADTVNALTEAQLRVANRQREGALHREVEDIRGGVLRVLGTVEATVDFEEEIGPFDADSAEKELTALLSRIEALLSGAEIGRLIRKGVRIAIIGPPNAGKSSLFNAIAGYERAIVTPIAGTTRDYVEESLDIGGIPVTLVDTAGIRDTDDPIETQGVERSRRQAEHADMTWFLYDATLPRPTEIRAGSLVIANKADLLPNEEVSTFPDLLISTKTGLGIDALLQGFVRTAEQAASLHIPPPSERHAVHLHGAREGLTSAVSSLIASQPFDLITTHLRGTITELGQITGETASTDMIERIFADFCIGK